MSPTWGWPSRTCSGAGHAPTARARRRCPRSPPPSPRSRRRPGRRARRPSCATSSSGPIRSTAKAIVKVSAASSGSACARGWSRRPSPRRSSGRSTTVKWAGMLTGDIGRLADARPRRPARRGRARPVPPAQVHARVAGRGRGRDPAPARPGGLGRGQVRRHPRPAPQARRRGAALQPRPARRQRPVPRGRRGRARRCAWDGILDGEILACKDGLVLPFISLQTRLGRKSPSARSWPRCRSSTSRSTCSALGHGDDDWGADRRAAAARTPRDRRGRLERIDLPPPTRAAGSSARSWPSPTTRTRSRPRSRRPARDATRG